MRWMFTYYNYSIEFIFIVALLYTDIARELEVL